MSTLIVAEKPSVARDIARVLGVKGKGEGCLTGDAYVVTWALGHLVALCDPDELDPAYKKWRMDSLPMLPEQLKTKVLPKTRAQFAVVRALLCAPETQRVICATDSGREGELIFRLIYQQAGCTKPVDRLWISSMTDAAIREGFQKLKPAAAYDALYESARCRAEADWLVGMNASRAFTLKYDALLSVGRVQTPTLKLIVSRDWEIRDFVPEDYQEVRADFGDYTGLWQDPEKNDGRCRDAALAARVKRETEGREGAVTQSLREQKRTPPPQLFDLTSLQREMNRLMGLSAAKTLEIAQSLYERHKLLTYPRTDSRYLPHDMIPKIKAALSAAPAALKPLADALLPAPPTPGRIYNDEKITDHHAIVPTGQTAGRGALNEAEARVYDTVYRRLIASHYPDYTYESATIKTEVCGHTFKTVGQTPVSEGWRALYRDEKPESDAESLPNLPVGARRTAQKVSLKKCKTKPPAPHTDASLLAFMENAGRNIEDEALREAMKAGGLGTPATRSAIIERLITVGYVARKGKALQATDKGERLIRVAPAQLTEPETTGKWERALHSMAQEPDAERLLQLRARFMDSIRRFTVFLVDFAKNAPQDVHFEPESRGKGKRRVTVLGRKCPLCHEGEVTATEKAFGCSRWREGCRFTVWRDQFSRSGGPALDVNLMKKLLDGKTVPCDKGALAMEADRVVLHKAERP